MSGREEKKRSSEQQGRYITGGVGACLGLPDIGIAVLVGSQGALDLAEDRDLEVEDLGEVWGVADHQGVSPALWAALGASEDLELVGTGPAGTAPDQREINSRFVQDRPSRSPGAAAAAAAGAGFFSSNNL